ncbi:MAG: hypothetical protein PHU33_16165 [Bacteroidales bacterium]|nr:hypothetical protein [Bacteroidales bacterium]
MNRDRIELLWLGKNPLEGFSMNLCNTNNTLSSIATPAGRLVPVLHNGQVHWKTEYNLTDHLGNVRVVFAAHANGQPEVMQQTSYYYENCC